LAGGDRGVHVGEREVESGAQKIEEKNGESALKKRKLMKEKARMGKLGKRGSREEKF